MHDYETVFILDPGLDEGQVNEEIQKVQTLIGGHGGEMLGIERWGRKRLAYEIEKKRDGIYTLIKHRSNGETVRELERRLRLNDAVIRVMTVIAGPEVEVVAEEGAPGAAAGTAATGVEAGAAAEGAPPSPVMAAAAATSTAPAPMTVTGGAEGEPAEAVPRHAVIEEAAE